MKCDKVSFTYRGTYQSAGCLLAKLLSDISVNYESTDGRVEGTADLGALLRDGLLKGVIEKRAMAAYNDRMEKDGSDSRRVAPEKEFQINIDVPTVRINDWRVVQKLMGLGVKFNKPVTAIFVADPDSL